MLKVAVLITAYNRREQILSCLECCYRQIDAMKANDSYAFNVYVLDDYSSDGTVEAITEQFPQTRIIKGTGILFWSQGMRMAWETAAKDSQDFYIWLRCNVMLADNSLACLMENSVLLKHKAIVVGTTANDHGELTRGGRNQSGKLVIPDSTIPVPCFTFDGSLVLIPKYVYNILGNLDPHYHHYLGDYDYGVRAGKANIIRVVAPNVLAECNLAASLPNWRNKSYSLKERFRMLNDPKGKPLGEQFLYDCRRSGPLYAAGHSISIILKVLFPKKGKRTNE